VSRAIGIYWTTSPETMEKTKSGAANLFWIA
jgi:hypothetical protein